MFIEVASNYNDIDWSATAAWIALAVAIISPIITTIITNLHQIKVKKIELLNNRGLDIIEKYISITAHQIKITGISEEYDKYCALIYLYAPKSLHKTIVELDSLIRVTGDNLFPDKKLCLPLLYKISKSLQYTKL